MQDLRISKVYIGDSEIEIKDFDIRDYTYYKGHPRFQLKHDKWVLGVDRISSSELAEFLWKDGTFAENSIQLNHSTALSMNNDILTFTTTFKRKLETHTIPFENAVDALVELSNILYVFRQNNRSYFNNPR